jgi:hypothetical protein
MKNRLAILAAALWLAIIPAAQAKNDPNVVPVPASATAIAVAPEKAYILVRIIKAKSGIIPLKPVFLRVPTDAEIAGYRDAKKVAYAKDLPKLSMKKGGAPSLEDYSFTYRDAANVFSVDNSTAIAETETDRTFLLQVPAGEYVLYGSSVGGAMLVTCNCLGTVKFRAEAGVVTDLGTLIVQRTSKLAAEPELASESGFGTSIEHGGFVLAEAVRPATAETSVPAMVPTDKRRLADYQPVAPFNEPGAMMINRLAPLPGILRYDSGKVIDDRTGKVVD